MAQLEELMQDRLEMTHATTNALQMQHQASMAIINNIAPDSQTWEWVKEPKP
jgi:hypothetical protein